MKRAAKTFLVVLSFSLLLVGCGREPVQQQLLKAMAQFDRAYIPTLIFAELNKPPETSVAFRRLENSWQDFYNKYYTLKLTYGVNITDELWQSDFDKISTLLKNAEVLVKAGKITETNELLAPIQGILSNLRHRHNLDYFLDRMIAFNDSLTELQNFIGVKTKLSELERLRLIAIGEASAKKWRWVEESKINWKIYGFNPKKVKAIQPLLTAVDSAEAQLLAVEASGDLAVIRPAVSEISDKYTAVYRVFGDFQPVFDEVNRPKIEKHRQEAKTDKPPVKTKTKIKIKKRGRRR